MSTHNRFLLLFCFYSFSNFSIILTLDCYNNCLFTQLLLFYPFRWLPEETEHSRDNYLKVLAHSDLTLNPVGMNPECYRIYEALSYGSIPVIEDVLTPGNCGNSSGFSVSAPHRLLKSEKAPVIFIKDWQKELPTILDKEAKMTLEQKSKRRKDVLLWYENFKAKMRKRFVSVIQEKFFGVHQFI